jgi:hypothetical protein
MTYCECYICKNYDKNEAGECEHVPKCPSFVRDKPDKSEYYTYCDRTPLKLRIDGMEKSCRFGYCVCFPDAAARLEYCYLCDDHKEGKE